MVMARISTSMDKVFAKKPHRQSYDIRACPAGDTLEKWVRGREGTDDGKGCVCTGQDREPLARGRGGWGRCQGGEAGLLLHCAKPRGRAQSRGSAHREWTTDSWMLPFSHKTTHLMAFLPRHGIPDSWALPSSHFMHLPPHSTDTQKSWLLKFRWRFDSNPGERMTNPMSKEGKHRDHILLGDALQDPGCSIQPSHAGGQGRDVQP